MNLFLLKEYIRYFHLKTDEHSLHSPFFYNFFLNIIKGNSVDTSWDAIESNRTKLLNDSSIINMSDLGAGSKVSKSSIRTVRSIAKHSLSQAKFSQFLFRLIQHFDYKTIVELGTSLGINTYYLASANSSASIHTFEGDPHTLKIAKEINSTSQNICFYEGDIEVQLPALLQQLSHPIDLVYADANHTYEASVLYFNNILPYLSEKSIYIMDDIHWSAGMKKAWEELKDRKEVKASIDLFDAGMLFFNTDLKKQHYILDF